MQVISSSELPSWFSLSKYQDLNRLDLHGWLINFVWRGTYINWVGDDIEQYREEIENTFREENGYSLIKSRSEPYDWAQDYLPQGTQSFPQLRTATVRSLEIWHIAHTVRYVVNEDYELSRRLRDASSRIDEPTTDPDLQRFMNEPFDLLERNEVMGTDFGELKVEIDLFAPDKIIIQDFKKWLKAARNVFDIPAQKLFSKAGQAKWIEFQILPYLDLLLWAKLEKVQIPYAVLGNALFPDEYDVDLPDRIRRVTKPKADWLTQSSVIEAIVRQLRGSA